MSIQHLSPTAPTIGPDGGPGTPHTYNLSLVPNFVQQIISATTGVAINEPRGVIECYPGQYAAGAGVEFKLTNNLIGPQSAVLVNAYSVDVRQNANACMVAGVRAVAAGSCTIQLFNSGSAISSASVSETRIAFQIL